MLNFVLEFGGNRVELLLVLRGAFAQGVPQLAVRVQPIVHGVGAEQGMGVFGVVVDGIFQQLQVELRQLFHARYVFEREFVQRGQPGFLGGHQLFGGQHGGMSPTNTNAAM